MSRSDLTVREWMRGHVGVGATDFLEGYVDGVEGNSEFMFEIELDIPDVNTFLADAQHEATAAGQVRCASLGGTMELDGTVVQLFVGDKDSRCKYMWYRLFFTSPSEGPLTMLGYKVLYNDHAFDLWPDITTLYVRILRGHVHQGDEPDEAIAMGIVRIRTRDFLKTLMSFRFPRISRGSPGSLFRFNRFFVREAWSIYGTSA